jgi:CheY-like chemotaxis protein
MLQRIFDPFFQSASARERSQSGLGLGLAIVASLVTLHGGTVTAHSDGIGSGSEFIIRLPLAAEPTANEQHQAAAASSTEPSTTHSLCVLVVDDNADAAKGLVAVLRRLGCTVHVAYDGPSALALLPGIELDLALLDIGMPVMDGHELARRLRALDSCAGAYLVAVTGYGQESDRKRALAAGFDEHIVKPVDLPRLREVIEHCNQRARSGAGDAAND